MPRMASDVLDSFLHQAHVGVIASLRRDGMPYSVPVWWLFEEGDYWLTGTTNRVWCKQLAADSRCSLCIEALVPVAGHVGVDGRAQMLASPDFDIWPMSERLAQKYVGQGDSNNDEAVKKFVANMRTEPRILFRLRPEVTRAIDMRVYRGKREDREFQNKQ